MKAHVRANIDKNVTGSQEFRVKFKRTRFEPLSLKQLHLRPFSGIELHAHTTEHRRLIWSPN